MLKFELAQLAVPAVVLLVASLSYSSQYLFYKIDPGPLNGIEFIFFNGLVACIWISYLRACMTDPGHVSKDWIPSGNKEAIEVAFNNEPRHKWCRKCNTFKPPRSHHCKICARCIPKMDHHCPWTINCVSHFTFPHFLRFLVYAVGAMTYLQFFLYIRSAQLWSNRKLPSYLGPSPLQLVHLLLLVVINSLTLFLVSVTLVRTAWGLGGNVTTIEGWEIERHKQLLRRARVLGGYIHGPDGIKIRLVKQEFPYDIGIWTNIQQGMGSGNPLAWLWPFAMTPVNSGLDFDTNGFEDPGTSWPPPDPDRMPRFDRAAQQKQAFTHGQDQKTTEEELLAFKVRQEQDLMRRNAHNGPIRRRAFRHRFETDGSPKESKHTNITAPSDSESGEEAWQDYDGNRLKDFGVDENVEFYDEDDVPLAELMRRRKEMYRGKN